MIHKASHVSRIQAVDAKTQVASVGARKKEGEVSGIEWPKHDIKHNHETSIDRLVRPIGRPAAAQGSDASNLYKTRR